MTDPSTIRRQALEERAAIMAWLLGVARRCDGFANEHIKRDLAAGGDERAQVSAANMLGASMVLKHAVEAIERGDHHQHTDRG